MTSDKLFDLTDHVALVTGASRGIGRAIALALARYGADVAIHYATRASDAEAVASEARSFGRRAIAVGGDLVGLEAPARIWDETKRQLGPCDILVLNASVQCREGWEKITPAQIEEQVNANFRSSFLFMQRAVPEMRQRKWGRIVAVGSVQQVKPSPQMAIYAATKCAQMSLVRNLARQVAADGITINNLSPGVIETDRNAAVLADPDSGAKVRGGIPVGFVGQPDDCAGAALLLCSQAGRYITGTEILVDGGWSL